jgi:hypothetical protein
MEPVKRSTSPARLLFLLGLVIILAGAVVWDRWADWGADRSSRDGASPPHTVALNSSKPATADSPLEPSGEEDQEGAHALARLDLDQLHDTIRRPLFEKRRRPVAPPTPAMPAPAPVAAVTRRQAADPNALTLLGILTSESHGAIALLRRNQTGQNVRLQEGDVLDEWTIERIEPERVVLGNGDTKIALQLFRKR